jgi:hypothetical protein
MATTAVDMFHDGERLNRSPFNPQPNRGSGGKRHNHAPNFISSVMRLLTLIASVKIEIFFNIFCNGWVVEVGRGEQTRYTNYAPDEMKSN